MVSKAEYLKANQLRRQMRKDPLEYLKSDWDDKIKNYDYYHIKNMHVGHFDHLGIDYLLSNAIYKNGIKDVIDAIGEQRLKHILDECVILSEKNVNLSYTKSEYEKIFNLEDENETVFWATIKQLTYFELFKGTLPGYLIHFENKHTVKYSYPAHIISKNNRKGKPFTLHPGTSRLMFSRWVKEKYNRYITTDAIFLGEKGVDYSEYFNSMFKIEKIEDYDTYLRFSGYDKNKKQTFQVDNQDPYIVFIFEAWEDNIYNSIMNKIREDILSKRFNLFVHD